MALFNRAKSEFYKTVTNSTSLHPNTLKETAERTLLQYFANAHGIASNGTHASTLWGAAAAGTESGSQRRINDNKVAFYTSPSALLFTAIMRTSGLVAYYPLAELAGNALNWIPAGSGTLTGRATGGPAQNQTSKVGKGYVFDGINDAVIVDRNTVPAWSGKSTLGFIAKALETTAADKPIIDSQWGDNGGGGWQIIVNNGNLTHCYVGDAVDRDDVTPTLTQSMTNAFHFIVVTKNTTLGQQSLYIDGVLSKTNSSLSFGTTQPDLNRDLIFGANHPMDVWLNCNMQHIFFASQDMTAPQILSLAKICGFA